MTKLKQRFDAAVPLAKLTALTNNPRRGDVGLLRESVGEIGFYGAVIVNEREGCDTSGQVLAGNHRILAAAELGETSVPVLYVDVDDVTARKIALVDNHANDRATYDVHDLVATIGKLDGDFIGTGYTDDDYADLLAHVTATPLDDLGGDGDELEDFAMMVKVSLELTSATRNRWEGWRRAHESDDQALDALMTAVGVMDDADD